MSWFRETMLKGEAKADQFESWVKDSVSSATDRTRQATSDAVDQSNEFAENYQERTESTLSRIPGYSGYKSKEQARDSDRALRDGIASQLDQDAARIETIQRSAADARKTSRVNELEPIVQGFRNAANLVRSLSYGYGGLFSDNPVDDTALAQLRLFDQGLLVKVNALSSQVDAVEAGTTDAASVIKDLAAFKASLELRGEVITEGRPVKPIATTKSSSAATKAFADESKRANEPVVLPEVSLGDAMSILGDDHIVEAIIDLDTGSATQRFIRLDNKPQMWLWFSTESNRSTQRLLAVTAPANASWDVMSGKARIDVPDERARSGAGTIRTASNPNGSTTVQLYIDGVVQTFDASNVNSDDIETYRAR